MANLLTDPVFTADDRGTCRLSLPGVLAALSRGEDLQFPALRPHQAPAWHAFLVQLAYLALKDRPGSMEAPPTDEAAWADALRALTADWPEDEPWRLATPPGRPAFLQAAVPDFADPKAFKPENTVFAADDLDMLVTSKNHDVKSARARASEPEDWVFALVSLQTQEGGMGRGNYGIARMNGAYGSRPFLSIKPGGASQVFQRDLRILGRNENRLWDQSPFTGDVKLTWLQAWDGGRQLNTGDVHPLCIEICRRVRLIDGSQGLSARLGNSEASRVDAKALNGATGDPWTPVTVADPKALSITEAGFSWRQMHKLLFGRDKDAWTPPLLGTARSDDPGGAVTLQARSLARGQGKTEGFHTRDLIIPAGARAKGAVSDDEAERRGWADRADNHAQDASTCANRILKPALLSVVEKGPEQVDYKNDGALAAAKPFLDQFDADVDAAFFPALWGEDGAPPEATRTAWRKQLAGFAEQALNAGLEAGPRTAERRFLAEARAWRVFRGVLYSRFKDLKAAETEDDEMEAAG